MVKLALFLPIGALILLKLALETPKLANQKSKLAFSAVKLATIPAMLKYGGTYEKQQ